MQKKCHEKNSAIERSTTELYAQYLEMRGVEPRTFRMQSGRATTVPHPHYTLDDGVVTYCS